jgi:hypothetical protein
MRTCLEIDVEKSFVLREFPQFEQKLADSIIGALQEEQRVSGGVFTLHSVIRISRPISYRLSPIEEFRLLLNRLRRDSIANGGKEAFRSVTCPYS